MPLLLSLLLLSSAAADPSSSPISRSFQTFRSQLSAQLPRPPEAVRRGVRSFQTRVQVMRGGQQKAGEASAADEAKADSLMQARGLSNCEEAAACYRRLLAQRPDDLELKLKTADAINAVVRIKTNANTMVIEGTQDTPSNKKLWGELGGESLKLMKTVYTKRPNDVRALAVYTDSFFFSCSSKGMIKQALTGAGNAYKANANALISKYPRHDSGVGYCFLGGFYLIAPWPINNIKLAEQNLQSAHKIAPTSMRNNYYLGVLYYRTKQWDLAAQYFQGALSGQALTPTEGDFEDFILSESKRALALCLKKA